MASHGTAGNAASQQLRGLAARTDRLEVCIDELMRQARRARRRGEVESLNLLQYCVPFFEERLDVLRQRGERLEQQLGMSRTFIHSNSLPQAIDKVEALKRLLEVDATATRRRRRNRQSPPSSEGSRSSSASSVPSKDESHPPPAFYNQQLGAMPGAGAWQMNPYAMQFMMPPAHHDPGSHKGRRRRGKSVKGQRQGFPMPYPMQQQAQQLPMPYPYAAGGPMPFPGGAMYPPMGMQQPQQQTQQLPQHHPQVPPHPLQQQYQQQPQEFPPPQQQYAGQPVVSGAGLAGGQVLRPDPDAVPVVPDATSVQMETASQPHTAAQSPRVQSSLAAAHPSPAALAAPAPVSKPQLAAAGEAVLAAAQLMSTASATPASLAPQSPPATGFAEAGEVTSPLVVPDNLLDYSGDTRERPPNNIPSHLPQQEVEESESRALDYIKNLPLEKVVHCVNDILQYVKEQGHRSLDDYVVTGPDADGAKWRLRKRVFDAAKTFPQVCVKKLVEQQGDTPVAQKGWCVIELLRFCNQGRGLVIPYNARFRGILALPTPSNKVALAKEPRQRLSALGVDSSTLELLHVMLDHLHDVFYAEDKTEHHDVCAHFAKAIAPHWCVRKEDELALQGLADALVLLSSERTPIAFNFKHKTAGKTGLGEAGGADGASSTAPSSSRRGPPSRSGTSRLLNMVMRGAQDDFGKGNEVLPGFSSSLSLGARLGAKKRSNIQQAEPAPAPMQRGGESDSDDF